MHKVGEIRAVGDIDEAGVANPLRWVVRSKYPKRREEVKWPGIHEIKQEWEEAEKDENQPQ